MEMSRRRKRALEREARGRGGVGLGRERVPAGMWADPKSLSVNLKGGDARTPCGTFGQLIIQDPDYTLFFSQAPTWHAVAWPYVTGRRG